MNTCMKHIAAVNIHAVYCIGKAFTDDRNHSIGSTKQLHLV